MKNRTQFITITHVDGYSQVKAKVVSINPVNGEVKLEYKFREAGEPKNKRQITWGATLTKEQAKSLNINI